MSKSVKSHIKIVLLSLPDFLVDVFPRVTELQSSSLVYLPPYGGNSEYSRADHPIPKLTDPKIKLSHNFAILE